MANEGPQSRTKAKSAGRALDILEILARERHGLTFTEVAILLKYPKSSLHELLGLLTERSFVDLDPATRRYSLGVRVWEVGQAYVRHRQIVDVALEQMEKIVASLNETVQLAILDRTDNVYLAKVDCTHPLRLQTDVGKRFPAYATALGKVLLSQLPHDEAARRLRALQLHALTRRTIVDVDELLRQLGRTRSQGFGVDWEEGMDGLRCVAVPIRDHDGTVAALSVSVPVFRASNDQMISAIRLLADASLTISRGLGVADEDPSLVRLLTMSDVDLAAFYRQSERSPVVRAQ
jgi:DNA-binding IclR family transcriptional regulator